MAHSRETNETFIVQVLQAPEFAFSPGVRTVLFLVLVFGAGSFAAELTIGRVQHAWISLQVNFLFWFGLTAASSCFPAVFHLCAARWSRPVERVFQAAFPLFCVLSLLPVALFFGRKHLFTWVMRPVPGKEVWLNPYFVYGRDVAAVLLLVFICSRVIRCTLRRDLGVARGGGFAVGREETLRWSDTGYDRFVHGWEPDDRAEFRQIKQRMSFWSVAVVVVYALSMSLLAFDQLMSVDPDWYSSLFGVFYFMSAVYAAFAAVCVLAAILQRQNEFFAKAVGPATFHDLGKLLFGFGIFWAYLFFSHYLPIWYGNMPEETGWVILRLREQPWHSVAWTVLAACFIVPFFVGLSREVKRVPLLMLILGLIILFGMWLAHYLMFAPTLSPDRVPLNFADLGIALGFFAIYLFGAEWFLKRYPLAPFGDLW